MAFRLSPGISYCRVDGRLLFFDVCADRYFSLGADAQAAFEALAADSSARSDHPALARPALAGLVVEDAPFDLAPCARGPRATDSLLDGALPCVSFFACIAVLFGLARTRIQLRYLGLKVVLERLQAQAPRTPAPKDMGAILTRVAAAFEASARLARSHDQCLARSLALAAALAAPGIAAELVIGVRLRPFAAHCWVQHGATLINDRPDPVLSFTPIFRT
ncbi:hypothetical protein BH10PSE12_BH10PSE12_37700 [soil metagenome]